MITVLEFELVNNKTCKYTQNPTDSKVAYSLPENNINEARAKTTKPGQTSSLVTLTRDPTRPDQYR